jgi:broad specificity phosphatase PhoE
MKLALALALLLAPLPVRAQEVVVLVRHGEKADGSDDPPLSAAGEARARALAALLRDARLTAVYASERQRTQRTAAPTAEAGGLKVQVHPAKDATGLAARIRKEQPRGRVLVVGHSNTLPAIAAAFGATDKLEIAETEYDNLLVLVPRRGRPPMVLRMHL